jgi:hypothetical protein
MNNQSTYGRFFGRLPALEDLGDPSILKYKKFSEIPQSSILTAQAKNYLTTWHENPNEDPQYVSMALSCLRSLYTVLKGQEPNQSSN